MTSSPRFQDGSKEAVQLRLAFEAAGQGQVFRFWDQLSEAEKGLLLEGAAEIDLGEMNDLIRVHLGGEQPETLDFSQLRPAPYQGLPVTVEEVELWEAARVRGEEALRQGKVAAFTVAGGQGTRLGYEGPKGTFAVTPVQQKSLFQVFAEKILAARRRYQSSIPWFILTSHANHEQTETFFRDHHFFGLPEEDVMFFRQGRMPAVDFEGKIILQSKDQIAMSPDGHGGSLRALCRSGAVARMEARGIEVISYGQVDNPLVQLIDPTFIGFHLGQESEMSSKMLPKAYPGEKVGVFVVSEGKMMVVEYSDLPSELAERRDESGELVFLSGSIAIHLLATSFVKRMGAGDGGGATPLPFHRADKKVPTVTVAGDLVKPTEPNGVKFEMFVFDALPFAANPVVIETRREDEFSPVKNAEGLDSPLTCRQDQQKQWARWLKSAGVELETDAAGVPTLALEVSPLFASDERSFVEAWSSLEPKPDLRAGLVLE